MRASSKSQAPSSREAPSSKQISKRHAYEDVSPARYPDFGVWNLEFLWSLVLGIWSLPRGARQFGIYLRCGIWDWELPSDGRRDPHSQPEPRFANRWAR